MISGVDIAKGWHALTGTWKAEVKEQQLPSELCLSCIEKDVPRTFPEHLSEEEKVVLRHQLYRIAGKHTELGYRSGFNFMLAFLDKLMQPDAALHTLDYMLEVVGFRKLHNRANELNRLLRVLMRMISDRCAWVQDSGFIPEFYTDRLLAAFAHRINVGSGEQLLKLTLIWDKIIRQGLYVMLEVIVATLEHTPNTADLAALMSLKPTVLTLEQIGNIAIQPIAYYDNLAAL